MKINFDEVLKDIDGVDMRDPKPDGSEGSPTTLKSVCVRALTIPLAADTNLTGEDAFKRLELARKVNKGGEQEIDPADAVTIRDRAAKMFAVQVSGQVYEKLR